MRRKISFIIYWIFWLSCIAASISSVHPIYGPFFAGVEGLCLILYMWVKGSNYDDAFELRYVVYSFSIIGMVVSLCVTKCVNYIVIAWPVFLGYVYMEGGYRDVKLTKRTAEALRSNRPKS